jgi:hypothetical protein
MQRLQKPAIGNVIGIRRNAKIFAYVTIKNGTNRIKQNTELLILYNHKNQHQELNRIKMKQTELKWNKQN